MFITSATTVPEELNDVLNIYGERENVNVTNIQLSKMVVL